MDRIREFPKRMSWLEAVVVLCFIVTVYVGVFMFGLDSLLSSIFKLRDKSRVWSSEDGLWDHPEPNYAVLPFVAEFFASATAIPLAGGFLLYQGLRFSYNTPVLVLYLFDCWMYSCAFFSHMLLWPTLNAVTLTSVLSNALYTFALYSGLSGDLLSKSYVRLPLTLTLWIMIVYLVTVLPEWFGQNGGVPALLVIQTPAVVSACAGAVYCWAKADRGEGRFAFHMLTMSGALLCLAMCVSLVEVIYGTTLQGKYFGIVPYLHIVIHILEQVGIYLYGVGVAVIEHTLVRPVDVGRPRILWLFWNCVPYLAITYRIEKTEEEDEKQQRTRRSPRLVERSRKIIA